MVGNAALINIDGWMGGGYAYQHSLLWDPQVTTCGPTPLSCKVFYILWPQTMLMFAGTAISYLPL